MVMCFIANREASEARLRLADLEAIEVKSTDNVILSNTSMTGRKFSLTFHSEAKR